MKTLYCGKTSGDIRCFDCAGYHLQENIKNARKNQRTFRSFDSETYFVLTDEQIEDIRSWAWCHCGDLKHNRQPTTTTKGETK